MDYRAPRGLDRALFHKLAGGEWIEAHDNLILACLFSILGDWGLEALDASARRDLYEILEERYGRRSTILTSQVPVGKWHEGIGDPTYADAILDRIIHNAHRIDLVGDSLCRIRSRSTTKD